MCRKTFRRVSQAVMHEVEECNYLARHHLLGTTVGCRHCPQVLASRAALRRHLDQVHGGEEGKSSDTKRNDDKDSGMLKVNLNERDDPGNQNRHLL